jgi:hypothetical protein
MKTTTAHHITDATTGETLTYTITLDVTPAPGAIIADLGHGVTIVRRTPPSRADLPGADWVAPYAANCAGHGWINSRATFEQAAGAGYDHIAATHSNNRPDTANPATSHPLSA